MRKPSLDVKTRWSSTYLMVEQAMKFRVEFEKMEAENKPYNDYIMELWIGKRGLEYILKETGKTLRGWYTFWLIQFNFDALGFKIHYLTQNLQ